MPGAYVVVGGGQAAGVLESDVTVLGQVLLSVVAAHAQVVAAFLVEDDFVEADAIALQVDVELAHGKGVVAGVAEALRHGRSLSLIHI